MGLITAGLHRENTTGPLSFYQGYTTVLQFFQNRSTTVLQPVTRTRRRMRHENVEVRLHGQWGGKVQTMFSCNCGCLRLCRGEKGPRQCFPAIADACVYAEGKKGQMMFYRNCRCLRFMQKGEMVQIMFSRNCGCLRFMQRGLISGRLHFADIVFILCDRTNGRLHGQYAQSQPVQYKEDASSLQMFSIIPHQGYLKWSSIQLQ